MQMVRPSFSDTFLSRSITRACSSWLPCEKLRRATSIPRCMSSRIADSELLEGPRVHTIFALREHVPVAGSNTLGRVINFLSYGLRLHFNYFWDNTGH